MFHLDDNSIAILEFVQTWCETQHVYDLDRVQSVNSIFMPRLNDCCYAMSVPEDLKKVLSLQFYEFAQDGEGGQYALWCYPELAGDPPVVFFSADGHYSMVAPSLPAFFALMALDQYMFPSVDKSTERVWQTRSNWHPDLAELRNDHSLETLQDTRIAFDTSLKEFHNGLSMLFDIKEANLYLEQMQEHKNFREWYQYVEVNHKDTVGKIGGNLYVAQDMRFDDVLETNTLLELLYQPMTAAPVTQLIDALEQDKNHLSYNDTGRIEIDREDALGLTVMFSSLDSAGMNDRTEVLTQCVFFQNWASDLPHGLARHHSYDDVTKLLKHPAGWRHKFMAFFRYWKLIRPDGSAYLLGIRFEKDLSGIKVVSLQTFTPEDEQANRYGRKPL
ncbi:hypothetical protein SAMN04488118_11240 [Epibacterium ulvae]|uniref:Uncharacterized protein n=1 Tax=Epibacterium ulvae TaxID=1156985 RepID=A0A1G5RE33_9RHOB|nr:hypothetical protein SAMN04488118_11240 [Epibacterium ulvae]